METTAFLFFREGTHDKVYSACVLPATGGFVVNYTYGRRGTKLQSGSKTPTPVKREEALRIFNSLVAEKVAKGYQADPQGPAINPMLQTREGRRFTVDQARALQSKLWSGNYTNSWGTNEEFKIIISEHPELLEMTLDEAAAAVLKNLAAWAPAVAAKELKARGASPEEREASRRLTEALKAAIKTREAVGPANAYVFVVTFDRERVPEVKKDMWAVMSHENLIAYYLDRNAALVRALEVVEKGKSMISLSIEETTIRGRLALTVRGSITPRQEAPTEAPGSQ